MAECMSRADPCTVLAQVALDLPLGNSYSRFRVGEAGRKFCNDLRTARVAELADALDLGSSGQPWGFESPLSHHEIYALTDLHRDTK